MDLEVRRSIRELPLSATLEANQKALQRARAGQPVYHMGFGQSPFTVHPKLVAALAQSANANGYGDVAGLAELRAAALTYYAARTGIDPAAYDVVIAPGSKLILYALQLAIAGDVIVPMPSWVSYAPQAAMLGDSVHWLDAALSDEGYRVDPVRLEACIDDARAAGRNPTKLILNSPNNPSGLVIPERDFDALVRVCRQRDVLIVSDEIYGRISFSRMAASIGALWPEGCAISTGLSKHLSLGGWRIGVGFVPKAIDGLFDAVCAIASETWSCTPAPIQRAALLAFSGDREIEDRIELCTRIHRAVALRVADTLRAAGISCALPQGAFYLWADLAQFKDALQRRGVSTSQQLANHLLEDYNVLTLPGTDFGAAPQQLALRLSVCDYDGGNALELCEGRESLDNVVEEFAPRVVAAAQALARCAQELSTQSEGATA